jgi:hypothetical protein
MDAVDPILYRLIRAIEQVRPAFLPFGGEYVYLEVALIEMGTFIPGISG